MPITITIQGNIIEFPAQSDSPQWGAAVDAFAIAVQNALSGVVGSFDVPPQVFIIDAFNPGTNVDLPNFTFPVTNVRSFFIRYAVFRTTSVIPAAYETGTIEAIYSPANPVGNKWDFNVGDRLGNASITFSITDTGQIQFTTGILAGINHTGKITTVAQAVLQSD